MRLRGLGFGLATIYVNETAARNERRFFVARMEDEQCVPKACEQRVGGARALGLFAMVMIEFATSAVV